MNETLIKLENVSVVADKKNILSNIHLHINKGNVLALVGLNGSGKSTLLSAILNFIKIQEGRILINNQTHTHANFKHISFLTDYSNLTQRLTVKENIVYTCILLNKKYQQIERKYFELFEIDSLLNKRVEKLSAGEMRRVCLFISFLKEAEILILDEPLTNIDPVRSKQIWKELMSANKTIIFSTQDWENIENTSTHIFTLDEGKVLCDKKTINEFFTLVSAKQKITCAYTEEIKNIFSNATCFIENQQIHILTNNIEADIKNISMYTYNFSITDITIKDIYLILKSKQ